jgi:ferredoxin
MRATYPRRTPASTSSSCSARCTTSPPRTTAGGRSPRRDACFGRAACSSRSPSRFATTVDGLCRGFLAEPGFEALVERDVAEGQHRNPDHQPHWFTTAYFHRPDELEAEIDAAGLEVRALLAVEGPVGALAEAGALDPWLDDDTRRGLLLRAIRRVEAEPSLLGASPHVLAVATRP